MFILPNITGEFSEVNFVHKKSISSANSSTLPAMVQFADYLKAYYKALLPMPKYKWPPPPSKKPFNLRIIRSFPAAGKEELHDVKSKEPISLRYILKPIEGRSSVSCVLIEGDPGVGKSSLTFELCRRWDEIETMKSFPLVILLRAYEKRVLEAKSLVDLVCHHDSSLQERVAHDIAACDGDGVLFVIDGADQLLRPRQKSQVLSQIVRGLSLPKASLLLTCRTSSSEAMRGFCKRRIDKRIELAGFTQEEVEQHAESILGYDSLLLAGFHEYISSNPIIRNVMHMPINTAIVVETFKEAASSKAKLYPRTITQLHDQLAKHLIENHMLLQGSVDDSFVFPERFEDLPPKVYQQLCGLAKLAFTGLVNQEIYHSKLPRGCFHLGFMTTSPELYIAKKVNLLYSFLNLNVQYYLTAIHISQLPEAEQSEVFARYSTNASFAGVWRFLAAITRFKSEIWDQAKSKLCKDSTISPFILQCLFEAHKQVPCNTILKSDKITFPQEQYGEVVTPSDCFMLGCCLVCSSCTLKLRLRLDAEMLKQLVCGLSSTPPPSEDCTERQIETLFLRPPITQQSIAELGKIQPGILQGLDMSHCELNKHSLNELASVLPTLVGLKQLDIRGNKAGEGGMVQLLKTVATLSSLESLTMINTNVGCEDINALKSLLTHSNSLKELKIGDEDMPHACTDLLMGGLFSNRSLQSLHLWLMDLEPHMNYLSELLQLNTNIQRLEFHGCKIGTEGSQALAESLEFNTTLSTLVLSMFDVTMQYQIGKDGAISLADMLKLNCSLERLDIMFDKSLERNGALALINALQENSTLKSLRLPQHHFTRGEVITFNTDPRVEWSSP